MMSEDNQALVERYFVRPRGGVWQFTDQDLNRLLEAAREAGYEQGYSTASDLADLDRDR